MAPLPVAQLSCIYLHFKRAYRPPALPLPPQRILPCCPLPRRLVSGLVS